MIIVLTGPTCTGKSKTALALAEKIDAEIINGDAFQIYQELTIGVVKPSPDDLSKVRHHLYSFVPPKESYTVCDYQRDCRVCLKEILARGKNVIIVGGSGLYLKAALFDYVFPKEKDLDLTELDALSNEELHAKLKSLDPLEAAKIHVNNRRRIKRALFISLSEGESKSSFLARQKHRLLFDARFFVRNIERKDLYAAIDQRVEKMIEAGLIEEARDLFRRYGPDCLALKAIGYKELLPYFRGDASYASVIDLIKQHTRNYAKRQMTFIRHQFPVAFYDDIDDILKALA